ncbi:polysaccharide deacetylase family protein [Microbacterium sp. CH12i]|uniref:polysaccharide deacetylase family protein n=1 Tax=Microbacterium sp. CH12i TaxID=1479651 RepID=UPI001F1579DA|nr:polysaccharide deacetylase family protein [Microbacterium sp. CH12i]
MNHIATTGFYLPTWDELSAFIDGRLYLPNHSVVITDDDADQSWFDLAVPVIEKYQVLSTSFMITAARQDPAPSPFVQRRSHTHNMHQAGANGQGQMVNLSAEEIAADLNTSGDILGVREVVAYPYGHYNDTAKQGVAMAGYEMARTIEPGYVSIGTDKFALPVVRINYGMGLEALINQIADAMVRRQIFFERLVRSARRCEAEFFFQPRIRQHRTVPEERHLLGAVHGHSQHPSCAQRRRQECGGDRQHRLAEPSRDLGYGDPTITCDVEDSRWAVGRRPHHGRRDIIDPHEHEEGV